MSGGIDDIGKSGYSAIKLLIMVEILIRAGISLAVGLVIGLVCYPINKWSMVRGFNPIGLAKTSKTASRLIAGLCFVFVCILVRVLSPEVSIGVMLARATAFGFAQGVVFYIRSQMDSEWRYHHPDPL